MDTETLELFISKAKLLKCNYVMCLRNCIIGTDEFFGYCGVITHTEPKFWALENTVFETKQFTVRRDLKYKFKQLIINVEGLMKIPVTKEFLSLHENEMFREILNRKADDGVAFFKLNDEYLISVNKSLIPLNKSDKLDLFIRDFNNGTFNGEFVIRKGKEVEIKKYFTYLKL